MEASIFNNPSLTIAFALAVGILAQIFAHHFKIPGIVILLLSGLTLGPDLANIIRPDTLGSSLGVLTGFAVAVILFEGGMNLKFTRLKKEQKSIQYLLLSGSIITITGGTIAARFFMEWEWRSAILFGSLVMVTGPTVINPLLKRLKVKRPIATLLEAEGVLIDAIGAIIAAVVFEAAVSHIDGSPGIWFFHITSRLFIGSLAGILAGIILVYLFKIKNFIPEGMENVFTLCIILALFQVTNAVLSESGLAAVTIAGVIMGNFSTHVRQDIMHFKEELTIMLIGMLFVLLAADVRLEEVLNLGLPGLFTVLTLIFIIRPLSVFTGTFFTQFQFKEKLFISWIGPRGIVAAAVASFFAVEMHEMGIPGGTEVRALVFLVITITVLSAGLTGGFVADILGLKRPTNVGWVILGANEVARSIAKIFKESGQEVICIDSNIDHCRAAEEDCTKVIYGNGLKKRYLMRSEVETKLGVMALTANEEVNFVFIQNVKKEVKNIHLYSSLRKNSNSMTDAMLHKENTKVAFATDIDLDLWSLRFKRNQVKLQIWKYEGEKEIKPDELATFSHSDMLLSAFMRKKICMPIGDDMHIKKDDEVFLFVFDQNIDETIELMASYGFKRMTLEHEENFSTSMCFI